MTGSVLHHPQTIITTSGTTTFTTSSALALFLFPPPFFHLIITCPNASWITVSPVTPRPSRISARLLTAWGDLISPTDHRLIGQPPVSLLSDKSPSFISFSPHLGAWISRFAFFALYLSKGPLLLPFYHFTLLSTVDHSIIRFHTRVHGDR